MKLTTASILALAGFVAAQSTDDLPSCAQPCVVEATTGGNIAGCGQFDIECICSNQSFLADMACCLAQSCSTEEQQAAVDYAKRLCRSGGVTDLPDQVVCSTASSAATTSASASTSGTAATMTTAQETAQTGTQTETSTDAAASGESTEETNTSNAGPLATMMPVGVLGGLMAAAALL
ncbi:hypothetical protein ACHAQA_004126 [Verticillium albo-atrum]